MLGHVLDVLFFAEDLSLGSRFCEGLLLATLLRLLLLVAFLLFEVLGRGSTLLEAMGGLLEVFQILLGDLEASVLLALLLSHLLLRRGDIGCSTFTKELLLLFAAALALSLGTLGSFIGLDVSLFSQRRGLK
jgi:hypothetical protein